MVLDAQGRLVELNRAGEELTGYRGEEIRGRKLWETGLVPEEEQSVAHDVFGRLRAGDFPNHYENHWITKDGRWRLLSWRNSAVLDEYGEVSRVVGTAVCLGPQLGVVFRVVTSVRQSTPWGGRPVGRQEPSCGRRSRHHVKICPPVACGAVQQS